MTNRSRTACISAAVAAALLSGGAALHARDLTFDDTQLQDDGQGGKYAPWDTTTPNWLDTTPANVTWVNSPADNAILGGSNTFIGATPVNNIALAEAITVQNLTIGIATNGATYNVSDVLGGSLTLSGNISKPGAFGNPQIALDNGLTLSSGDHTITVNDTSGDGAPELAVNGSIGGSGNVIIDNASFITWGSTAFTFNNTYTGTTTISKGRLEITKSNGLGSDTAGTTISNLGTLSIGGSGTQVIASVNITEPITIQRSVYTGGDYGIYPAAIIFNNNGTARTNTLSGPIVIDSADARISVNTGTLVLPGGNITLGPSGGAGVLSFTGDYSGFVQLQGSNPALATNGIKLVNAVEVSFDSDASLGGPAAPISFTGDATLDLTGHPTMTTFGTHPINTASFGGGLDIPMGQSFTLDQTITGGLGLGKRGAGSLTFANPLTGTGSVFWDAGTVNINAPMTLGSLHLRSPVVNINNGGSITTTSSYSSFGQDSTGTANGPDIATINLYGNAKITAANQDFNISDNANTMGTINLNDTSSVSVAGVSFLGKTTGATGTVVISPGTSYTTNGIHLGSNGNSASAGTGNVTVNGTGVLTSSSLFIVGGGTDGVGNLTIGGGTVNANQTGSQSFVIGGGTRGKGTVNMTAGTLKVAGEFWDGNNATGIGAFTQSAGATTIASWFVVGRLGAAGTLTLSGGTITRTATNTGNNNYIGENAGQSSVMTINGTGAVAIHGGQFWIGNGSTSKGTMNIADSGSFLIDSNQFWLGNAGSSTGTLNITGSGSFTVVNNWLAVGRNGTAGGIINLNGGSLTRTGAGSALTLGSGATANGLVNQTAGALSSDLTYVGESGTGIMNLSGGTASLGGLSVGLNSAATGTLTISSTAAVTAGATILGGANTANGTINLNGGSLTLPSLAAGTSTGAKTFNFNGGTLRATADAPTFLQGITSNVKSGGTIDVNGHSVIIAQALLNSGTGGLTKTGAGALTLNGANTYVGPTVLNGTGSVILGPSAINNTVTGTGGAVINSSKLVLNYTTSPDTTVAALLKSSHDSSNFRDPAQLLRTTNSADATHGLGYYDNGASSSLTVMYTWYGDANLDGKIDADDYALIDRGAAKGISGWVNGDFNYDGVVNSADYMLIDTSYGISGGLSPSFLASRDTQFGDAYVSQLISAVPEPTTLGLIGIGAVAAFGRRRRNA